MESITTGKSIWDEMPEEWEENASCSETTEHLVKEKPEVKSSKPLSQVPVAPNRPADDFNSVNTGQSGNTEEMGSTIVPTRGSKIKQKKIDKKKYDEFEKRYKENKINSSEHAKKAYQKEERENKHDFKVLGIALSVIIAGIILFVVAFTKTSTQHVYDLINQGNYSIAYQEIKELYEKNRNVDSLVYAFAEECARNSEYKRAVASLEYLSSDAEANKGFFDTLIDIFLSHGKTNRALEVIDYMQSAGGILSQYSNELYNKYIDRLL